MISHNNNILDLEELLKSLKEIEKLGLDTSSLRIFIKNYKVFLQLNKNELKEKEPFDEKMKIIKAFLEDTKVFPRINDVISFANKELKLDFKDQKESRPITIDRIIKRIIKQPELKNVLKEAVLNIRNEKTHNIQNKSTKKELVNAEKFLTWADLIKDI